MKVHPMARDEALSTLNGFLGVWLIATCFLWRHSTAGVINSVLVGLACIAIALLTLRLPAARWLYVPLSAWLVSSAWILPLRDTFASSTLIAIGTALFLSPITLRWLGQDDPREGVQRFDDV